MFIVQLAPLFNEKLNVGPIHNFIFSCIYYTTTNYIALYTFEERKLLVYGVTVNYPALSSLICNLICTMYAVLVMIEW